MRFLAPARRKVVAVLIFFLFCSVNSIILAVVKNVYKEEVHDFYLMNNGPENDKRIDAAVRKVSEKVRDQLKPPPVEAFERIRMLGYLNISVQMFNNIYSFLFVCLLYS